MKNNNNRGMAGGKRLGLMLLTPIMGAMFATSAHAGPATVKLLATGKIDKRTGALIISGSVKGVQPGTAVSVVNASTNEPVYNVKTDLKGKFLAKVPGDPSSMCRLSVTAAGAEKTVKVNGADKACRNVPVCSISEGNQQIAVGASVHLTANAGKSSKKDPLQLNWLVSNTGPTVTNTGSLAPTVSNAAELIHTFDYPGLYQVTLNGSTSTGVCKDSVTVSVSPSDVPTTVDALAVSAQTAAAGKATALNAADGSYVVLPFEETGMQGGSQINLPYNPMIPYNSLNVQVIQKKASKPPIVNDGAVSVYYSAGVNPNDPVGPNSINSTSQNYFADGGIGSNVDYDASKYDSSLAPEANKFIEGQDFLDAVIRKTEQWDRLYQKNHPDDAQTGYDNAWQQNRFTPAKPMARPDEGIRGYVDNGDGVRSMPGIGDPYAANDPQPVSYNSDQAAFVAQFIPTSNVDDKGRINPYPLMHVEAKVGADTVATTDTVYTTASETRCRECHLPGGIAADEDVWRAPVTENELTLANGDPGPATGAGSYDPGLDSEKAWPPAIHNRFDDVYVDNPTYTNLGVAIPRHTDANGADTGIRTDRVKAVRWVKLDANGNATSETTDVKPNDQTGWTIQFQLKFKSGADYGAVDDPMAQEKAALFNTLVMHDYMVFYGPTPATGKTWPAKPSSQLADNYSEDDVGLAGAKPQYFCSGHHQSQLKFDVGIATKSPATNRSDYSRAFHAFHGKMQVYKQDVSSGADGKAHSKGELIRDTRGHPVMYGGRGWDSQMDDDNGIPLKSQGNNPYADSAVLKGVDPTDPANASIWDSTKFTVPGWDPVKNNWRPDLFHMYPQGELMLQFGSNVAMEDNCVTCHTGKTEKSYRDIHHAAGLKCDACHGDMLAVGNVFPNDGFDQNLMWGGAMGKDTDNGYSYASLASAEANLKKSEPNDFRRPWLDQPDCGSCHVGDANDRIFSASAGGGQTPAHLGKDMLFSAGALKQAWLTADRSGKTTVPMNARFAVMPHTEYRPEKISSGYAPQPLSQALYRKSGDVHGSGPNGTLTCSTCHGGSHAIWPNPDANANDNVTAKQLQGYDGNIAECSVCHVKGDFDTGKVADGGKLVDGVYLGVGQGYRGDVTQGGNKDFTVTPNAQDTAQRAFLAGPHGLHPVGDKGNEAWWKDANGVTVDDFKSSVGNGGWHSEMTYKPGPDGEDQCAACHGSDHKGTRLSKTLIDREFVSDKGKTIKVAAGQVIGCDLCHAMKVSFKRAPNPKAKTKDGGWPQPKLHLPPMPEAIGALAAGK